MRISSHLRNDIFIPRKIREIEREREKRIHIRNNVAKKNWNQFQSL